MCWLQLASERLSITDADAFQPWAAIGALPRQAGRRVRPSSWLRLLEDCPYRAVLTLNTTILGLYENGTILCQPARILDAVKTELDPTSAS
jgi:hypothetical protein